MSGKRFVNAFFKCLVVFVIVVVPLSLSAQSKKDRSRAKTLQEQADQAYLQRNYREAADAYGQSIVLVPNNAYAHYRKGFSHFNLKESDQAISEFTTSLNQGFKPLEIYRVRAFIYYEQNKYDEAMGDIDKGLALDPDDLLFLKGKGEINLNRKAFPAALDAFQRAARIAPDDADVPYNMARVYYELGDAKAQGAAAATALAKGIRFSGEAYYFLGDAERKQKHGQAAIDAYQRSINSKPDMYLAYINLADVYRSENRFNDAITISKQALQMFPNERGNLYTSLSWYYSLADRPNDAVQAAKAGM